MKKNKIFIACDSTNITKVKEVIKKTKSSKLTIGYKFGLEFFNSKNGREFIAKLKKKNYLCWPETTRYTKYLRIHY